MSFPVPPEFEKDQYDPDVSLLDSSQVYFIQVPKGFDIKKLDGKKFSTHHVNEVGREDGPGDLSTVYGLTPYRNKDLGIQPLISSGGETTIGGKVKGLLSVTKSYEARTTQSHQVPQLISPGPVPMPEGLRTRFTPFGAGSPVKMPVKKTKKKSRKRHLDVSKESPYNDVQEVHRKKRRKLDSGDDGTDAVETTPRKKKKHKEREKAVSITDATSYTESDVTVWDMNNSQVSGTNLTSSSKKKPKKSRSATRDSDDSGMELMNALGDSDASVSLTGERRKTEDTDRSHTDYGTSSLQSIAFIDRNGDSVNSDSVSSHMKHSDEQCERKKKKKSHSRSKSVGISLDITHDVEGDYVKRKKKKKDKRLDVP